MSITFEKKKSKKERKKDRKKELENKIEDKYFGKNGELKINENYIT